MVVAKQKFQFLARPVAGVQRAFFSNSVLREPPPKVFRFIKLDECACKVFRSVSDKNFLASGESHSLDGQRSCNDWNAKRHALIDLAFHARPKSQRRNR